MLKITNDAVDDVVTFYYNALMKYPNWTIAEANRQIDIVLDLIENTIVDGLKGNKTPLLSSLDNGATAEMNIKRGGHPYWYFTVQYIDGDYIVENAWHYSNASNRAFRRGVSNPTANPSLDDRRNQGKLEELDRQNNKHRVFLSESRLRNIIRECIRRVLRESLSGRRKGKRFF